MQRKIKVAIIGCGKVSHLHAAALQQGDNTELTAITETGHLWESSDSRK
jgi:predicted dehydrogenase